MREREQNLPAENIRNKEHKLLENMKEVWLKTKIYKNAELRGKEFLNRDKADLRNDQGMSLIRSLFSFIYYFPLLLQGDTGRLTN